LINVIQTLFDGRLQKIKEGKPNYVSKKWRKCGRSVYSVVFELFKKDSFILLSM